jgi:protein TonB
MDVYYLNGSAQKLGTTEFQMRPVVAAMLFSFFIHLSVGWYLLETVKDRAIQHPPQPIEFKVVKPSEPLLIPPVPLPMSPAPLSTTESPISQPKPRSQQVIRKVSPKSASVVEPQKQLVEKPEKLPPPSLPLQEAKLPLIGRQEDNIPAGPPSEGLSPGGGGGGGIGDGNGLSEGGIYNGNIATGPGGGGIGTGFGTGIGSGVGPGVGSGIGTGTGSGIGEGTGSGVGSGEEIVSPIFDAAYLSNPIPEYPSAARKLKLQGTVIVRVLVNIEGKPDIVQLEKSSGISSLDGSALSAVKKWSFVPARSGDKAVSAWVDVPIRFRLN